MTFEAGRKKQILVLQPKGKPLYENNDTSSFGLKMLQTWGWKKGNGLGKTQQGNLDFIQVRYRNNANGLGFDGLKDNQWTQNEANFDSLLKNLNNSQPNSNSNSGDETEKKKAAKSLEEMSKQSRARVHYKKFTRGKDVYKYSEKDLANILGKKSLKEPEQKEEEVVKPVEDDIPDTYKSDLIINTGVSITDYFNQKRNEKNGHVKHRQRKDSQKFIEEDIEPDNIEEVPEITEKPKKKKKKSKCNGNDQEIEEIAPIIEDHANEHSKESNTKKRKKNKADLIEPVEEQQEVPAKKKKKSKVIEEALPTQEITDEKINKKKKKKKQAEDSEELEAPAVSNPIPELSSNNKQNSNLDVDRPRGANAVYSTDVVLIPSHVAQKMGNVLINKFNHSNIGDIVGYGMTDDIEIKVVETKMGNKDAINNDKYALYNMDRIARERVNPRKILTKIKKTKKSIQVI